MIDVAVIGGGPAGLLAALLAARAGAKVALVAAPLRADTRTTALLDGSVAILRDAGLWSRLEGGAAPLRRLRLVDGGRRLFRAPEITFDSAEVGLDAFGWNVPNAALTAVLGEALAAEPGARVIAGSAVASRPDEDQVAIELEGGLALSARLVIAADGRRSLMREAAGIELALRRQPQTALAFCAAHERDHDGVSTEFHCEEGPFTLVPMPGLRSSVVWVVTPERAEELRALGPDAFGEALTRRAGRLLGAMRPDGPIGAFPIEVGAATRMAARRTLLVGEAAHVLPPIGAQGLNLGVRDAAAAARAIAAAIAERRDVGGFATLSAYSRDRASDVWSRTVATDALNRSLMSGWPAAHAARGAGVRALAAIGPLRRFVMRQGLGR
ncbi:FAD-dependent monooxygenase [Methylopila turkensis]|uniref:2-octaprenyl-6-methoxyphenyl hydroxylase n=1 Tax=Methylopila turkensis TaxID=1437816 RepID=A0A9W6N7N4_9HYPH|nr:FAD-dependent monooxygenase [Methylopila turkensis]GLK80728.1 2-octaprenyl-6-methoxyphenyl hydroxylase [Methylopila turkensis]